MAGSSAGQARAQAQAHGKVRRGVGASAGRPTVRDEPGIHTTARRERQRAPRIALGHEAAARREAGSRSGQCCAARAIEVGHGCAQRPGRTHPVAAAGGAHLPQHRTEPRVASPPVEAQAGNSTVRGLTASPTRACFRVRARAHARVQRSFGPTRLCAGARGRHQSLSHSIPAHAGPARHPAAAPRPPSSAPLRARARADARATRASAHVARTALDHEAHAC